MFFSIFATVHMHANTTSLCSNLYRPLGIQIYPLVKHRLNMKTIYSPLPIFQNSTKQDGWVTNWTQTFSSIQTTLLVHGNHFPLVITQIPTLTSDWSIPLAGLENLFPRLPQPEPVACQRPKLACTWNSCAFQYIYFPYGYFLGNVTDPRKKGLAAISLGWSLVYAQIACTKTIIAVAPHPWQPKHKGVWWVQVTKPPRILFYPFHVIHIPHDFIKTYIKTHMIYARVQ